MRLLFTMDAKNYNPNGSRFSRPSARGIILAPGGKLAMAHVQKYDYYKFPGGGIEPGEDPVAAMIREVREETGLAVIPESVREYGRVHRIEKGDPEDIFEQDNYYYFCRVAKTVSAQQLDPAEQEEGFALEWVNPETAIARNWAGIHAGYKYWKMVEREARVLKLLVEEGYFACKG